MNCKTYVVPSAVLSEKPEAYELKVTIPGIGKDELELHVEGRTLSLKTASKYQSPAGFKTVANEFERCDYAMSVDLPEMADTEKISAKVESGVLTVAIAKRPETQPRRIEIA
ncbi:MAG: Hsp20/alpha crystallin family protein [Kiritimatiellae bacterium]|nr:Hsp20/alpha crystallin family protein [Kiritimatiellia bacterium]